MDRPIFATKFEIDDDYSTLTMIEDGDALRIGTTQDRNYSTTPLANK